jgi:hypothetical protein
MTGERGSRFEPLRDHLPVVGLDGRPVGADGPSGLTEGEVAGELPVDPHVRVIEEAGLLLQ